jgi:prepilin peptidase CpaA
MCPEIWAQASSAPICFFVVRRIRHVLAKDFSGRMRPEVCKVSNSAPTSLLLLVGALLLVFAALHDIGFRTVPNRVSVALLACGILLRLLDGGPHQLMWGLLCGGAVFLITYACWRFGWMGGADVKLLTAAAVFVPPLMVPTLLLGTSLAGGVIALTYIVGSFVAPRPAPGRPHGLLPRALRCELRRLRRRGPLPYAAAIATGGVFAIVTS